MEELTIRHEDERVLAMEKMLEMSTDYMSRIQQELKQSKRQLEVKNKYMDQSLQYSSRLQSAISPSEDKLRDLFRDAFIINKPKETVGGDTLWIRETGDKIYVASIDCTGHGVPGAMLTMAAHFCLNAVFEYGKLTSAARFLDDVLQHFRTYFTINDQREDRFYSNDAMDIGLCVVDKETREMNYSSINHTLTVVHDGIISRYRGGFMLWNKCRGDLEDFYMPIGDNMSFYLSSDGFKDQLGGKKLKKFGSRRLDQLLSSLASLRMSKQKDILLDVLRDWQGREEQTDDMLMLGFKA